MTIQEKRLCGKALLREILGRLSLARAKALDGDFRPSKVVPQPMLGVPIEKLFEQFLEVCSPEKRDFILKNYHTIIAKGRMVSELEAREMYDFYNVKGKIENGKIGSVAKQVARPSKTK